MVSRITFIKMSSIFQIMTKFFVYVADEQHHVDITSI